MKPIDWDIRREGRRWSHEESDQRCYQAPEKIEYVDGIFASDRQRLIVLGMLLENLGIDRAIRYGKLEGCNCRSGEEATFREPALIRWTGSAALTPLDQPLPPSRSGQPRPISHHPMVRKSQGRADPPAAARSGSVSDGGRCEGHDARMSRSAAVEALRRRASRLATSRRLPRQAAVTFVSLARRTCPGRLGPEVDRQEAVALQRVVPQCRRTERRIDAPRESGGPGWLESCSSSRGA